MKRKQNKIFLTGFFLCLLPFALSAQRTVSGHITDSENDSPIAGVHVFITGTTAGTTTNPNGYYQLKIPGEGSYQLAVSHVAYETVYRDIEPGKTSKILDVVLPTREMEDIEIAVKIKSHKEDVDLFWKTILGKKPSKKTIYAKNPEDVYFYYNSQTKKTHG